MQWLWARLAVGRRRWVFGTTIAAAVAVMGLFVASALGVLPGSPSQFEAQDGDMIAGNSGGASDWNSVQSSSNYVHLTDLASTTSDDSFKSGQKQDSICPVINTNKNPPKDDFTDVASFNETNLDASNPQFFKHTFLDGATIRFTANGSASENVELNQGTSGNCGTDPVTGVTLLARSVNDKLIAIDFHPSAPTDFHVLTWIDGTNPANPTCFVKTDSPPCWGALSQPLAANTAEGLENTSPIAAPDNKINNTALVAGQFAEFGIDLTAAGIVPTNACSAFPQTVWESRSSGSSFVSSTEDISLEHHAISNCGEIIIKKHTVPRGLSQVFSYTSNLPAQNTGGVACTSGGSAGIDANGNFCLNDTGNSAGGDSTGNTVDTGKTLFQGQYTVTEGADPTGFAFDSVTCTGGTTSTTGKTATITLAPDDKVTCTYVNKQQLGAIKITKTSSKAAATPLAGAKFSIKDPNGNPLPGSPFTTDSNGVVCVDGLTPLGNYTVQETAAPTGYSIDDSTTHTVGVTGSNAKCSDATFGGQSLSFTDTPLTDVTATATSEVAGGTKSTITCVDSSTPANNIGNSPQGPSGSPSVNANGLKPGTYTCTIVVDP
jgi:hypothetical protein